MIHYRTGNLFDSKCEVFVNTVNCVGVMGKGIALEFKKRYPDNFQLYKLLCDVGKVVTGKIIITYNKNNPKWIINFPTKNHWRNPSQLDYIERGLNDLKNMLQLSGIKSIAIPALGCSNGGLNWEDVKARIEFCLGGLSGNIYIEVYEPN